MLSSTMRPTHLLRTLLGAMMILGGFAHFVFPTMYGPMIPEGLPKDLVNYGSGVLEIALGVGVFVPRLRWWATLGILLLMLVFLPVHVIDYFRDVPAIGSKAAAAIRIPLQFVLIGWAWWVHRSSAPTSAAGEGDA
jgi:uncharacterized membrane protein